MAERACVGTQRRGEPVKSSSESRGCGGWARRSRRKESLLLRRPKSVSAGAVHFRCQSGHEEAGASNGQFS